MLMSSRAARRRRRPLEAAGRRLDRIARTVLPGRHPRRGVRGDEPLLSLIHI